MRLPVLPRLAAVLCALVLLLFVSRPGAAQVAAAAAVAQDPAPDKANPAGMVSFQLPSHGALLNAFVYVAAGAGPHASVVLLHGFPGNERNLDLAQVLRRAGYDVLFFDYRGSWGSPGEFSFTHSIEDTQAAVAYLRDAENARRLRADPGKIILMGHSMGGFMARYVGARDPAIRATVLISAADMGVDRIEAIPAEYRDRALAPLAHGLAAEGIAPLAGCTAESLAREVVGAADTWNVPGLAPAFVGRPLLVVTSDDGLAPSNDAFVTALRGAGGGAHLATVHLATDHSYSGQRIALETTVLVFLEGLKL